MSYELTLSNAQHLAREIIKAYKFLKTVTEPIIIQEYTITVHRGYLSMSNGLLYTSDETNCSIRVLDTTRNGDFISYNFMKSKELTYYHPNTSEAFELFKIYNEEEYFQYCTVYTEKIVFCFALYTVLIDELSSDDDHFYMDLNNLPIVLAHIEGIEL